MYNDITNFKTKIYENHKIKFLVCKYKKKGGKKMTEKESNKIWKVLFEIQNTLHTAEERRTQSEEVLKNNYKEIMANQKKDEAILQELKSGQEEMKNELGKTQEEVGKMHVELGKTQGEVGKLNGEVGKLNGEVGKLHIELGKTNTELRKLSQTVARIEYEHGGKIQAILDTISSYPEKFESIENRLESIETKIDRHSDQIYCLNSKVQAF